MDWQEGGRARRSRTSLSCFSTYAGWRKDRAADFFFHAAGIRTAAYVVGLRFFRLTMLPFYVFYGGLLPKRSPKLHYVPFQGVAHEIER